jgi:hypothetical protein
VFERRRREKSDGEKFANNIRRVVGFHVSMRLLSWRSVSRADLESPRRPFDHPLEGQSVAVMCRVVPVLRQ